MIAKSKHFSFVQNQDFYYFIGQAYDDTDVFFRSQYLKNIQSIVHLKINEAIVKEYVFKNIDLHYRYFKQLNQFCIMLGLQKVAVTLDKTVSIIDLKKKQIEKVLQFGSAVLSLKYLRNSQLLSIKEEQLGSNIYDFFCKGIFTLTFYKIYDFDKPWFEFKIPDNVQEELNLLSQKVNPIFSDGIGGRISAQFCNNHSLFCFSTKYQENGIRQNKLYFLDLLQIDNKPQSRIRSIKVPQRIDFNWSCSITEVSENLLILNSPKKESGEQTCYVDLFNLTNNTIVQVEIPLKDQSEPTFLIIEGYYVFWRRLIDNSLQLQLDSLQSRKIEWITTIQSFPKQTYVWKQSNRRNSRQFYLVKSRMEQMLIDVIKIKFFTHRQVYMHLLLSLNQDFDDDLLLDSMRLLGYQ